MIVRIITVHVKPGSEDEFERLTTENHEASLTEPGVLRFDVLRDNEDPCTYYLYEAYRDEASTFAHKETDHYSHWKEHVAPLLAGERTSVTTTPLVPMTENSWRGNY
ncbi:MAG: antibiotic biosynthesis monooxygenase [Alkalispirochaeta sp.]